ncbi:choice-of-anchor D domain-containing protein [Haloferula sp. A504]|uniref:choice-of-anchor D domain-containing protein n=1 Tax=Haloferula sp. A504 TaxID=3373601 RepID=UPI0031CA6051|nr:choice-of-anchor D domain-containing protein [Verrucomicrobiaceae bacterium E54]
MPIPRLPLRFRLAACLCLFPSLATAAPDFDLFGGAGLNVEITVGAATTNTADGTDFGVVDMDGPPLARNFLIRNNGDQNLLIVGNPTFSGSTDFSISGLPPTNPSIAPGGSAIFTITFDPSGTVTRSATIGIVNTSGVSGESPFTFAVSGKGVIDPPEIVVEGRSSPTASYLNIVAGSTSTSTANGTDFGSVPTGTTRLHQFRIRNIGAGPLTISASDDSDQFGFFGLGSSVSVGINDNFDITFQPTTPGTKTATFTIENNDLDEDPFTFTLTGIGTEPDIAVKSGPPSFITNIVDGQTIPSPSNFTDFGTVHVDDPALTRQYRIENSGNATLIIDQFGLTGPDSGSFSLSGLSPGTAIAPGANVPFSLSFDPLTAGPKSATVTFENNDPDEDPYTFAIGGLATGDPEITVEGSSDGVTYQTLTSGATPVSAPFGTLFPGTAPGGSVTHPFRITNSGTDTLTLPGNSSAFGFAITGLGTSLAPGQSDDFDITFIPLSGGLASRTVSLANNDADENPFVFTLEGTGLGPEIAVLGGTPLSPIVTGATNTSTVNGTSFGSAYVDRTTITHTFSIQNSGSQPLNVSSISLSGLHPGDFSLSGFLSGSVPAGSSASFDATFDPSDFGTRAAVVTIANDDFNEGSYTFAIRGNGVAIPEILVSGAASGNTPVAITNGESHLTGSAALNYQPTAVGSPRVHEFNVENAGNTTLSYTVASDNPDFQVSAGAGGSVGVGGSDTFTVTFDPGTYGDQTATLTLDSNDPLQDPFTFTLAATGTAPDIAISGNGIDIPDGSTTPSVANGTDFDQTLAGDSITRVFPITNQGNAVLFLGAAGLTGDTTSFSFAPINDEALAPGESYDLRITFSPIGTGTRSVTFSVDSSDPDEDPFTFVLTGTATRGIQVAPDLEVKGNGLVIGSGDTSPATADGTDFGSAVLGGASVSRTFDMRNLGSGIGGPIGSGDLTSIQVTCSHPDVSISGAPATMRPGDTDSFTVDFSPATPGLQQAVISIASNDPNEDPYTFAIALQVDSAPPSISDFSIVGSTGSVQIPTEAGKTYTLTSSTTLLPGSWLPVPGTSPVAGDGNPATFSFSVDPVTDPRRFYRVEVD